MRPIALAIFFATIFISTAAHGAPENLADFADAWGKGNVTHWPPPAPPAAPVAPVAKPPAEAATVPPALQPGGDPTLAHQEAPTATQPGTAQDMQQTGQLPEGRLRDADDDAPQDTPSATTQGATTQGATAAEPPAQNHASPPAAPSPGVGSVNPNAKELWQFSAPKAK